MAGPIARTHAAVAKHGDILLAAGLMGVLVTLIVPLPTAILDVLITFNFAYVLLLMVVVLGVASPLELSTFPTLLLIGTLFRLALNVASTRLILLHADAGRVIESFGNFVVGGEMIVGLVVFFILVVIQFVVITKGAERISEVAARFTLDAMPGKQMSIDADLSAGLINDEQAKDRRQDIIKEADFYGAMDGASKYVRGDAIAGIVIVLINIVGGIVIGLRKGMGVPEALRTYALLTVGDGLVSQIPAVIMSTAAGILVTKSATSESLSKEMGLQVLGNPRAVGIAAVIIFGFMLMPGLPILPFFVLGLVLTGVYLATRRDRRGEAAEKETAKAPAEKKETEEQAIRSLLDVDRVAVEVGYNLIRLIDPEKGGTLLERIKSLREKLARELGIVLPKVRIRDNVELDTNAYRMKLLGHRVAEGQVYPGRLMAMKPEGQPQPLEGIKTTEPSFGLPVVWVRKADRQAAEMKGCTVVDPESVFITHLSEVLRRHAHEILNREDVKQLLENARRENPTILEELVPGVLPIGQIQQVLQNLLAEGVPIKNLPYILEKCGNYAPQVKDPVMLTEMVRKSLGRAICARFLDAEGSMNVLTIDPQLEEEFRSSLDKSAGAVRLNLPPERLRQIIEGISQQTCKAFGAGAEPVVLTDAQLRLYVRDIVGRVSPDIPVLSYDEIGREINVKSVGVIVPAEREFAYAVEPAGAGLSSAENLQEQP